jgi:polysaccharide pyruvyl transferase WcaK-like protein
MKLLLVGDNTAFVNWGGRGATLALLQLLSEQFQITNTIKGTEFLKDYGYINTIIPSRYRNIMTYIKNNSHRRAIYNYYLKIEKFFGAKEFISQNPEETANNILNNRKVLSEAAIIYDKCDAADIILIHGEGDMVFSSPARKSVLFLLGLAELGLRMKKKVVIANSIVSDCPITGCNRQIYEYAKKIFSKCAAVILRDYQSFKYVNQKMEIHHSILVPDSLFYWYPVLSNSASSIPYNGDFILSYPEKFDYLGKLKFSNPYICISGSALAGKNYKKTIEYYSQMVSEIARLGYDIYLVETCEVDKFLQKVAKKLKVNLIPSNIPIFMGGAILANASLFISGRFHPSILASLGGTPCVFLSSNAHKMKSVQNMLEYEYIKEFSLHDFSMLKDIYNLSQKYINAGTKMRHQIKDVVQKRYNEVIDLPIKIRKSDNIFN